MDSVTNNGFQAAAFGQMVQNRINLTGEGARTISGDFQKLLDKAQSIQSGQSSQPDRQVEQSAKTQDQPKTKKNVEKKSDGEQVEEDPVETTKRLQVYLAPVSPEELAQYPASCLPTNLREGEPIVLVGVQDDGKGGQVPILVGADTAEKMFGKQVIDPALYNVSDPKADAMLEATDPNIDHSPAAMLEKVTAEQFGKEVQQVAEEIRPQQDDDDQVVITDANQTNQYIFQDVKNIPVKVGETENPEQAAEPDVAQQVDSQIAQALQQGDSMVRIQLTPENLGSVTVEISQSADGILHIALNAHSSETRGLLERHAADLQGLVSSRTQQEVQVDVQRGQESQQGQNQQNYDGHNGNAQQQQERRQRQEHTSPQDFMQQLRLGLIPMDEES